MTEKTNIVWHEHTVQRDRGCVLWFTGLSGSGKSTVANCVDQMLFDLGARSYVLDGDNIRHGLNASVEILAKTHPPEFAERFGLGFSPDDRQENIRRIGAVGELFCAAGLLTLTAFVSPYRADRNQVRSYIESHGGPGDFIEIFVDTPLEICEQRDPKGLYREARAGNIKGFTGIDAPYEPPQAAEIVLAGGVEPVETLGQQVIDYLRQIGKLSG